MRIKFVKAYQGHQKGSIFDTDTANAITLINKGQAILTKEMQEEDYKTLDEEQANGEFTKLRTYKSK